MSYAATHSRARAMVQRKGVAVTFTRDVPGTYDEATDTWTEPDTASVAGHAVRTKGDPERYRALSLVESEAPTLLFAPATLGALPPLDYEVEFGGVTYTVRDVDPVAPDGVAIVASVVVAR